MTFPTQGQTSYSTTMAVAVAGMAADAYRDLDIVGYVCSESIPFGCAVTLDTTTDAGGQTVFLPKSTSSTIGTIVGVAMYVDTLQQNLAPTANVGWPSGTMVSVCRKGRVYGALLKTATNPSPLANPNLCHASDDTSNGGGQAKYRGFFTAESTSTSAGIEVTALPSGFRFIRDISTTGVCLIDINLPNGTSGN
jgi:hypothetical protein